MFPCLTNDLYAVMDDRRFEKTNKRTKRLVLDFEKNPGVYRDLDDFLDIIDFYLGTDDPFLFAHDSKLCQAVSVAENIYPDSTDIKVQRAHIYFMQGNTDSAKNILTYLEQVEPDHVGVLLGLADCCLVSNRLEKGLDYLKRIIEIDPNDIEIYDLIIHQCLVNCKVEEAFQYFKKRIALKSDDDDELLGCVNDDFLNLPKLYEAIRFYEAFLEKNPYSSSAWAYMAMAHYDLEHDDEALEDCEYALAINAQCTAAYLTKFQITNDRKVLYEALNNVQEKEQYHINVQLGESYFRKHQYSVAAPYYRSALKYLDESNSDDDYNKYLTRNKLANCYMRMSDPVSAEKLLVESVAISPYNPLSYNDLEILYKYEFRDAERFEQMFTFLIKKFPNCIYPCLIYLGFLVQQKRFDDVVAVVTEAEKNLPDNDDLYIPLSVAYFNTNRKNEALLLLNNMDIDPTFLEDMLRKYDNEMLLDNDVMDLLLQKRDESDTDNYFDDNYDPNNSFTKPF